MRNTFSEILILVIYCIYDGNTCNEMPQLQKCYLASLRMSSRAGFKKELGGRFLIPSVT